MLYLSFFVLDLIRQRIHPEISINCKGNQMALASGIHFRELKNERLIRSHRIQKTKHSPSHGLSIGTQYVIIYWIKPAENELKTWGCINRLIHSSDLSISQRRQLKISLTLTPSGIPIDEKKEPKISGAYDGRRCQINGMFCSIHWQVASLWVGGIRMRIYQLIF